MKKLRIYFCVWAIASIIGLNDSMAQRTQKPILYGRHWVAVTGKPLAATAGARIFMKGGNAVDAACAGLTRATRQFRDASVSFRLGFTDFY